MDNFKTIYEHTKQKSKQADKQTQTRDDKKRDLILKDKTLIVRLDAMYIDVSDGVLSQIYGIKNIKRLYIHKDISLSISECFAISKYIKIFFIDANGNIVGKYKRVKIV